MRAVVCCKRYCSYKVETNVIDMDSKISARYSCTRKPYIPRALACAPHNSIKGDKMRKFLIALLTFLFAISLTAVAPNTHANASSSLSTAQTTTNSNKKRGPVFRATKEQIKQAQGILRQRGFYGGQDTGKLDTDTRTGLRKYQEAEGIKVTGTLNRLTLQKMNITLTDKQQAMPA